MDYTGNEEDLKRSELVKAVMDIEANYTKPDTLTLSDMAVKSFGKNLMEQFRPFAAIGNKSFFSYSLEWETTEKQHNI